MILALKRNKRPSKKEIAVADRRLEEDAASLDQMLAELNEYQHTLATLNAVSQISLAFITSKGLEDEFEAYCSAEAKEAVEQLVEQFERGPQEHVT